MSGTQPEEEEKERPESDYSRQTVKRRGMRTGYTTGSCAAAAAKAAALTLLTGQPVHEVTIHLPVGRDVTFTLHRCQWLDTGRQVLASVIKDGGDGYTMFRDAKVLVGPEQAPSESDILQKAITSVRPIAPKVEGRVTRVDTPKSQTSCKP